MLIIDLNDEIDSIKVEISEIIFFVLSFVFYISEKSVTPRRGQQLLHLFVSTGIPEKPQRDPWETPERHMKDTWETSWAPVGA